MVERWGELGIKSIGDGHYDFRLLPPSRPILATGFFPEPLDLLTRCTTCGAPIGERCRTDAGRTTKTHSTRIRKLDNKVRARVFVCRVEADDPDAGLRIGDFVVCIPTHDSAGTVQVLARYPDGLVPASDRVNIGQLRFLGWADELDDQEFEKSPGLYEYGILRG